jgi:hypothetical protein
MPFLSKKEAEDLLVAVESLVDGARIIRHGEATDGGTLSESHCAVQASDMESLRSIATQIDRWWHVHGKANTAGED